MVHDVISNMTGIVCIYTAKYIFELFILLFVSYPDYYLFLLYRPDEP